MGKLAHDNKAPGSADTVNDAVVLRQFMSPAFASASLIRGDLLNHAMFEFVLSPVGPTGKPSPGMSMSYQLT